MAHNLDTRELETSHATAERLVELNRLADQVTAAAGLLGTTVPHLVVDQLDSQTGNPSVIVFAHMPGSGRAGLKALSDGDLVSRASDIVASIGEVLGLGRGQASEFAANPHVTDVAGAARVVRLAQHYRGIPIFHATNAMRFGPDGEPAALVGKTVTVDGAPRPDAELTAEGAVLVAARFVTAPASEPEVDQFGGLVSSPMVDLTGFHPRLLARSAQRAERPAVFDAGPFAAPIRAGLIWFPRALDDLRLAWEIALGLSHGAARYRVLVDAQSGQVLYARQLIQAIQATAGVFTVDGGGPRATLTLPVPASAHGLPIPPDLPEGFPGDWVALDRTAGNSTIARFGESDRCLEGQMIDGLLTFSPASETGDDQRVLNAFYLACRLRDYFYLLGFREKDWNFQADNARAGGAGGDPVHVEVHPGPIDMVASMDTLPEGTSPVLRLGLVTSTGRHTAMDATVVTHEFTHGVTNRLVGGPSDVRALDDWQCRAMGEGWGDYVACTALGKTAIGAWLVGRPGGVRGLPYDEHFPAQTANFGKLGQGRFREAHPAGEIWAATLLEMNRLVGSTLGLQLVIHALKLSPSNPSFLTMRDAILAAVTVMADADELPVADVTTTRDGIWKAFAKFGMGPKAMCNGASVTGISPDFVTPPPEAGIPDPFGHARLPASVTVTTAPDQSSAISPSTPDAQSTLVVTDTRNITTIRVTVDIEHPATEHLRVSIRAPAGGGAVLHNALDVGTHLARSYTPDDVPALASLVGRSAAGAWSLVVVDLVGASDGSLRSWSLDLGLAAGAETGEALPALAIPDNNPAGVESTIALVSDAVVAAVKVQIDITHPQPADLRLELVAPSGRRAVLRELSEPAGGLVQSFESGSHPRLAELVRERIAGVWTLRVADGVLGDTGTLNRWRLTVRPAAP